jgi:hypothetical protein
MESVLLGMAAPVAASSAGNLLEGALRTAAVPFTALLQAITSTVSPESEDSAPAAIEGLHGGLDRQRDELAANIQKALTSAGVELTDPITLRISSTDGHLEVVGDHPQKALIEAALADEPDLADKFTEVATFEQLLTSVANPEDPEVVPLGDAGQEVITATFTASDERARLEFDGDSPLA